MRDRGLLKESHLPAFKEWLVTLGWEEKKLRGFYEILRMEKQQRYLIVYQKKNTRNTHVENKGCTIWGEGLGLARKWLLERKNNGKI